MAWSRLPACTPPRAACCGVPVLAWSRPPLLPVSPHLHMLLLAVGEGCLSGRLSPSATLPCASPPLHGHCGWLPAARLCGLWKSACGGTHPAHLQNIAIVSALCIVRNRWWSCKGLPVCITAQNWSTIGLATLLVQVLHGFLFQHTICVWCVPYNKCCHIQISMGSCTLIIDCIGTLQLSSLVLVWGLDGLWRLRAP